MKPDRPAPSRVLWLIIGAFLGFMITCQINSCIDSTIQESRTQLLKERAAYLAKWSHTNGLRVYEER